MSINIKEANKKIENKENLDINQSNPNDSVMNDFDDYVANQARELKEITRLFHENNVCQNNASQSVEDKTKKDKNESQSQINNANLKPQVSLQKKSVPNTIKHMASFLETPELAKLITTSKDYFKNACSTEMAARKKCSEELLHYVFQADPNRVANSLAEPNVNINTILTKTAYGEGYLSNKLKQFVCFRFWPNVSPLQAAALCGDNFLVRHLLTYIIKKEIETKDASLRLKASAQLQEIIKNPEYLIFFKALITAYNEFLNQYANLYSIEKWNEIDTLWEKVGECHKRLSRYGLQEFFDAKPFDPLPTFDTEPNRGELRDWNNKLFDLDSVGIGTGWGLYKGSVASASGGAACVGWGMGWAAGRRSVAAINRLFELRKTELGNIISRLQNFDEALSIIPQDKDAPQKQKP